MLRQTLSLTAAVLLAASTATGAGGAASPSLGQMVGQLLLVRMHGETPSASFLARVRAGQVGGVVLYSDNFGPAGPGRLVTHLQDAARAGGQPPLLIAIDQEGGIVKRLPGAPSLAPPQMHTAVIAEAQGLATARNLAHAGVNVDLAPVLDVAHGGFITPRSFGTTPTTVAALGPAFAVGLARGRVLATAKHFPGLGYATLSTDQTVATVTASAAQLHADWLPYRTAIRERIPLVMMSTAVYPTLGSTLPAAFSSSIVGDLRRLGFNGVIVTDALQTPAVNKTLTTAQAAVSAIRAGCNLALAAGVTGDIADTDGASIPAYRSLVSAASDGRLRPGTIRLAYRRVEALKQALR